ncbi:hypothetical protein MKQ68_23045 [Chitinophaga horti]|uniref:Transposase n=1 Tax=Chitinophaga horti TaxID=2920382 RepID=A0ABY6IZZ1_9BACT|nr:hypothetical protein [Chitinophaga horti]UYQ92961.1 hypothetical protein MKQ68_23045 [Chitinophaga horti]
MENVIESFTASCYNKQPVFSRPAHKKIVTDSLKFLVDSGRIRLYGFVIMPTSISVVWSKKEEWGDKNIYQVFLKYTAQRIKHNIKTNHRQDLEHFRSRRVDRIYQFWERKNQKVKISSYEDAMLELNFIHALPHEHLNFPYAELHLLVSGLL